MANLRLLGGSEGTLLIENNGRFYPVCDAMFKQSQKERLAEHVCNRLGLGQVLFVGNKEEKSQIEQFACEKWESSCEKCLDAFMVVGGKCTRQKKDKPSACEFKYAAKHGQGSCIKGRSELLIKCDLPSKTKRRKHGAWSSWSDCDPDEHYFRHRSRECKHGALCKGHWLEMTPSCRCTDDVAKPDQSYSDYYSSDSSYESSLSEIIIPGHEIEESSESFDPAYIDYYSERAHRPTVGKNKNKKYKEDYCRDAHLFAEKKSHFSSSCESRDHHKKKTTTTTSKTYTAAVSSSDLSTIMADDLDPQVEIEVHLRQVTPVTDVLGNETLAEGGMAGWSADSNLLLLGTVSIGLILLVTAAVLYVKCVINKKEDKTEKRALSKEKDDADSRHEGDVFACQ